MQRCYDNNCSLNLFQNTGADVTCLGLGAALRRPEIAGCALTFFVSQAEKLAALDAPARS